MEELSTTRFADLVQVRSADGRKFGSGRVVARNLVLTARHVVTEVDGDVLPPAGVLGVYRWADLQAGNAVRFAASVAWQPPVDRYGRHPDVLLLELAAPADVEPELPLRFGQAPADPTPAWAAGFPWLLALPERSGTNASPVEGMLPGGIDEFNLPGHCFSSQAAAPTLSFKAAIAVGSPREPAHDTASRWCGLSGGVVVIGDCIVGVMRQQDRRFAPDQQLDAVPLASFAADAALQRLLPNAGPPPWPVAAPRPAREPPPRAVQELSDVLHTLDRMTELGRVDGLLKQPADQSAQEVVLHARDGDLPGKFFLAACEGPLRRLAGQELPPLECNWPTHVCGADEIEADLALQLGRQLILGDYSVRRFKELEPELQTTDPVPWVLLRLPPTLDAADADVLERWRMSWSEVAAARRDRCGYFLSFEGSASAWQIVRQVLDRPLRGVAQHAPLVLQTVRLKDLEGWPNFLAVLARKDPTKKRYTALAAQLLPHIQVRNWVRFQPYDLQRVMIGDGAI